MAVKPEGKIKKGRPRLRWIDEINFDVKACSIRCLRMVALDAQKMEEVIGGGQYSTMSYLEIFLRLATFLEITSHFQRF